MTCSRCMSCKIAFLCLLIAMSLLGAAREIGLLHRCKDGHISLSSASAEGSAVEWRQTNAWNANTTNTNTNTNTIQQQPTPTPSNLSSSAKDVEMMTCLRRVLWEELPIARVGETPPNKKNPCPQNDIVQAHHGNAWHWQSWNKAVASRMAPLRPLEKAKTENTSCSVWEVGANVAAADSQELMKMYGNCKYHAFEPIPPFYQELEKRWTGESRMKIHGYGLAKEESTFVVSESQLNGESTYIADSKGAAASGTIEAKILPFDRVLSEIGIPTLMHMNCEGCEYDFLPQAKEHGFLDKVAAIQIGWHNYGKVGLGARVWQLCEIRVMLMETHVMKSGLAFGWDRWLLKEYA